MATNLKVRKVNALPGTLEASTMYMVKSSDSDLFDLYVSANDASSIRRIISKSDIQSMVSTAVGAVSNIYIVADIAARNALAPTVVTQALVINATADETVQSGAAAYIFNPDNTTWIKITEYESLDLSLTWANINNRPQSTVVEIDDAVSKAHSHTNQSNLDKIGEDEDGIITYDGAPIHAYLSTDQW